MPYLTEIPGGVRLRVQAQPGAKTSQVVGVHGTALKIKIKAPPVDGKANEELIAFLAGLFGVNRNNISIKAGAAARTKTVIVTGVSPADARLRVGV